MIALGGVGVISVASNEIPREMADMTRAALDNDWQAARTLHRKYLPLMLANFIESSPLPVKAVLAMMGKIEEVYRLPLLPMRRDTRSKLAEDRNRSRIDYQARGSPRRRRPNSIFTKIGRPARTKPSCTGHPADSAAPAKDAPPATIPIIRAGTALTAISPKPARQPIRCPEC